MVAGQAGRGGVDLIEEQAEDAGDAGFVGLLELDGDVPHLSSAKFVERFGAEAMRCVNSRQGRQLRLRGMITPVVQPGLVRPGDVVT